MIKGTSDLNFPVMSWGETLDYQKSSLRWDIKRTIKSLCKRLADIGEECFVVSVNVNNGWVGHMGSVYGDDFINENMHITYRFLDYCRESIDAAADFTTAQPPNPPPTVQMEHDEVEEDSEEERIQIDVLPPLSPIIITKEEAPITSEKPDLSDLTEKTDPADVTKVLDLPVMTENTDLADVTKVSDLPVMTENTDSSNLTDKLISVDVTENMLSPDMAENIDLLDITEKVDEKVEKPSPPTYSVVMTKLLVKPHVDKPVPRKARSILGPQRPGYFPLCTDGTTTRKAYKQAPRFRYVPKHACTVCNKFFKHKENFEMHLETAAHKRNLDRDIICYKCLSHFDGVGELYRHVTQCQGSLQKRAAEIAELTKASENYPFKERYK